VLLAELEAETLGAESALLRIDDALTLAHQIEQRGQLALTHRLRGDILLKRDLADPSPAEEAYRTAKLYQSTSRPAEAYAVLAPALEGFAPTPQMPEVGEAQALLKSLA
jgi:hypothetical protein